jgi:uncharacterized protein
VATRLAVSRIDAAGVRTPSGAVRYPAVLTRVGVLPYVVDSPEGPVTVRELRPPEEVFQAASLDTLRGAPLVVGHPAFIDAANWRTHVKGHVADDVSADASTGFVRGTVQASDAEVIARADAKELVEISCGYEADLEITSGVFNGEAYDAIQRNIRYNHVGLGPIDWGRAGNSVRLNLDSADGVSHYDEETMNKIRQARMDSGAAPANASAPKADTITHTIDIVALAADRDAKAKALEAANAKVTALEAERAALLAAQSTQQIGDAVSERIALLATAESLGVKCAVTDSADAIRIAVLAKLSPSTKCDGRTSDAIALSFEVATAAHAAAVASANASGARVDSAIGEDSADDDSDPIEEAKRKQDSRGSKGVRVFGGYAKGGK